MTWPVFLRDEHGTIVLEEVDEDRGTATYRVYGRGSLVVGPGVPAGAPPALRAALTPAAPPPASSPAALAPRPHRGRWVAAGVAAGIAVVAARRRR
jgi:hypothetical protein